MGNGRTENLYFCDRKKIPVNELDFCRRCRFRKSCSPFQRYIQPDLPLAFKAPGYACNILESQDHIKETLNRLMPREYKTLERKARRRLPKGVTNRELLVRIKMFEILVS